MVQWEYMGPYETMGSMSPMGSMSSTGLIGPMRPHGTHGPGDRVESGRILVRFWSDLVRSGRIWSDSGQIWSDAGQIPVRSDSGQILVRSGQILVRDLRGAAASPCMFDDSWLY